MPLHLLNNTKCHFQLYVELLITKSKPQTNNNQRPLVSLVIRWLEILIATETSNPTTLLRWSYTHAVKSVIIFTSSLYCRCKATENHHFLGRRSASFCHFLHRVNSVDIKNLHRIIGHLIKNALRGHLPSLLPSYLCLCKIITPYPRSPDKNGVLGCLPLLLPSYHIRHSNSLSLHPRPRHTLPFTRWPNHSLAVQSLTNPWINARA